MSSFDEWRRRLARVMEQRGDWPARSPWVRQAVDALARDRFAPERVWWWDGHAYIPVDRTVDPDRWAAEVYGDPDAAAVTQVVEGLPSSSLSCEAVVVDMLDSLLLEPGHRVLELGTGTGRNAALLGWRTGAGRVTSVEVDPALADRSAGRTGARRLTDSRCAGGRHEGSRGTARISTAAHRRITEGGSLTGPARRAAAAAKGVPRSESPAGPAGGYPAGACPSAVRIASR